MRCVGGEERMLGRMFASMDFVLKDFTSTIEHALRSNLGVPLYEGDLLLEDYTSKHFFY